MLTEFAVIKQLEYFLDPAWLKYPCHVSNNSNLARYGNIAKAMAILLPQI